MSDLISKQKAIDEIRTFQEQVTLSGSSDWVNGMDEGYDQAVSVIELMNTVEAEPVRHGRWVEYPECLKYENAYGDIDIVCSCCEAVFNIMDNDSDRFDYCPSCGAKMDERKEE